MKRLLYMIILSAAAALPATASRPVCFRNPVTDTGCADPTVWRDGKTYYMISTGLSRVMTSTDLVDWRDTGTAPLTEDARDKARGVGRHFWAPDVIKIGDKWMMYVSLYNSAEDCGIGVFESDRAMGPWEYAGILTHSRQTGISDTIDPEVVIDPESGKIWLFFGSVGRIHRIELNDSGTGLAPDATYAHVAGLPVSENKYRNKVFEGSYLYRRGGWWYLFVSSGFYDNPTYNVKVGRSRTLEGEFLDMQGRRMTEGFGTLLMSSQWEDQLFGPGHNGEIFTDSRGRDYFLFHCHDSLSDNPSVRQLCLQRLYWDERGWPYVLHSCPAREDDAPVLRWPFRRRRPIFVLSR